MKAIENDKAKQILEPLWRECQGMIRRLTEGLTVERSADEIDQFLSLDARDNAAIEIKKYREKLKLLDECLERTKKDEYGVCKQCEGDISPKRLDAVPWAIYCIKCEDLAHQDGGEIESIKPVLSRAR